MLERDNTIQSLQQDLKSLQQIIDSYKQDLRDMKVLELRRLKDLVYGRNIATHAPIRKRPVTYSLPTDNVNITPPYFFTRHGRKNVRVVYELLLLLRRFNRFP